MSQQPEIISVLDSDDEEDVHAMLLMPRQSSTVASRILADGVVQILDDSDEDENNNPKLTAMTSAVAVLPRGESPNKRRTKVENLSSSCNNNPKRLKTQRRTLPRLIIRRHWKQQQRRGDRTTRTIARKPIVPSDTTRRRLSPLLLFSLLLLLVSIAKSEVLRVFTAEELKQANGVDSDNLYLCLFGRVYDVAKGAEYYQPDGGPYHIFVGKDSPVPFVTGVFDDEEAAKPWDTVEVNQHASYVQWVDFYEDEEKYPFLGVVEGLFYDKDGNPTPEKMRVLEALEVSRKEIARKAEERKKKIEERKRRGQYMQKPKSEL